MSAKIEHINAGYADVSGASYPGTANLGDDTTNEVACVIITSQFSGDGAVIEGPPAALRKVAEDILRMVELIEHATMESPRLRALYGATA